MSTENWDEWVKSSEGYLQYRIKREMSDRSGTFVASLIRNFHHFHNLLSEPRMLCDGLSAATPVKPPCQWKEWEGKGTLAARSQHSVHLEVSSHPSPHTTPHVIKLLSRRCLFLFASAQVLLPRLGLWGSLSVLRASARHPNCESYPQWQQQ